MVDLQAEFRCKVHCWQAVPSFLRVQFRMALVTSLEAMRAAYHSDHAQKCRSGKFFRLISLACFCGARSSGDLFYRQEWTLLLDEARHSSSGLRKTSP